MMTKDGMGWNQPHPRVLGRDFLLEDPLWSYWYYIVQGDFSGLCGPQRPEWHKRASTLGRDLVPWREDIGDPMA